MESRTGFFVAAACAAFVVVCLLAPAPGLSQRSEVIVEQPPRPGRPERPDRRPVRPPVDPEVALRQMMARTGRAPVIVMLRTPFTPEGELDGAGLREQRDRIRMLQDRVIRGLGGEVLRYGRFTITPGLSMVVTREGYGALRRHADVDAVVPNLPTPYPLSDSVPAIGAELLHDTWGVRGAGSVIAFIDTGIDRDHPFFAGRILHEACFSPEEWPADGPASGCPNGEDTMFGPGSAEACGVAGCRHGTAAAGVAAGDQGGDVYDGVAPEAGLVVIQTAARFNDGWTIGDSHCEDNGFPASCVLSMVSNDIQGLEHLVSVHKDVVAIDVVSLNHQSTAKTGACGGPYKPVIDTLTSLGVIVVAPSGNFGSKKGIAEPACVPNAIAVGSVNKADQAVKSSQAGPQLDVFAPGVQIRTADVGGGMDVVSGTSFAMPHVAGAVALLRSVEPDATLEEIRSVLVATGVPVYDAGADLTRPRIQIDAAMSLLHPHPSVSIITPGDGLSTWTWATLTFRANAAGVSVSPPRWYVDGAFFAEGADVDAVVGGLDFPVGFHTITAEVSDGAGLVDTDSVQLHLYNLTPSVSLSVAPSAPAAGEFAVLDSGSNDVNSPGGMHHAWTIDGVLQVETGASLVTAFSQGNHVVHVVATDADGVTASDQLTVPVGPPRPGDGGGKRDDACAEPPSYDDLADTALDNGSPCLWSAECASSLCWAGVCRGQYVEDGSCPVGEFAAVRQVCPTVYTTFCLATDELGPGCGLWGCATGAQCRSNDDCTDDWCVYATGQEVGVCSGSCGYDSDCPAILPDCKPIGISLVDPPWLCLPETSYDPPADVTF